MAETILTPEQQEQSFAEKLAEFDTSPTTSQTIASNLGATPDQLKMIGTDAQKKSTIQKRIEETGELFRVERLQPVRKEPTFEEVLAQERSEKLAQLGDIGRSVSSRIEQEFRKAATSEQGKAITQTTMLGTSLGLSDAQLELAKQDPNSKYNKIAGALQSFIDSKNPNDLEFALATIDNLKQLGLSSTDAKRLMGLTQDLVGQVTGQTVAQNVMDELRLKDLDLSRLGFTAGISEIASILGKPESEIEGMTLDELESEVEGVKQREFSRIETIKAELAKAPSGSRMREVLLQELRDLGQVGVTGIETTVANTVEEMDLAQNIKIGANFYKVTDLLDDENLSSLITDWINESDPVERDKLIPADKFPELIAWINANEGALAELSTTVEDTTQVYQQTQQDWQNIGTISDNLSLTNGVIKSLLPNWDPTMAVTSKEFQATMAKMRTTAIGSIVFDPTLSSSDKSELAVKFNSANEELLKEINSYSKSDILAANAAAEVLREDSDIADFAKVSPNRDFVFDENEQIRIRDWAEVVGRLKSEQPSWLVRGNTTLELKALNPDQVKRLLNSPANFRTFERWVQVGNQLEQAQSATDYLKIATQDSSVSLDRVNRVYQEVLRWSRLGDPNARAQLQNWTNFLGLAEAPPVLSEDNVSSALIDKLHSQFNISLDEAIAGSSKMEQLSSLAGQWDQLRSLSSATSMGVDSFMIEHENLISDGVLDVGEVSSLDDSQIRQLEQLIAKTGGAIRFAPGLDVNEIIKDRHETVAERKVTTVLSQEGFNTQSFLDHMDRLIDLGTFNQSEFDKINNIKAKMQSEMSLSTSPHEKAIFDSLIKEMDETLSAMWQKRVVTENFIRSPIPGQVGSTIIPIV